VRLPSGGADDGDDGAGDGDGPAAPAARSAAGEHETAVATGDAPPVHETTGPETGPAHGDGHHGDGHGIHMPSPSYMPALTAVGFPFVGFGAIYGWWWGAIGVLFLLAGVFGWGSEPLSE
jgi:hypothetical protein